LQFYPLNRSLSPHWSDPTHVLQIPPISLRVDSTLRQIDTYLY
jgi:hypothetical protein